MASAATLYTPEVLALATSLAAFALDDGLGLRGDARSPRCGSSLTLGLSLAPDGRIERVGVAAHACAIGQAAAAIFVQAVVGMAPADIAGGEQSIIRWLEAAAVGENGAVPDWPGLAAIAPAAAYPARHGAITLAWRAALAALASREAI